MAIEIYTVLNLKTSTVRHYHISYAISRESITQTCSLRCLVGQATVIYMSIKQVHTGYLLYIYINNDLRLLSQLHLSRSSRF